MAQNEAWLCKEAESLACVPASFLHFYFEQMQVKFRFFYVKMKKLTKDEKSPLTGGAKVYL